MDAVSYSNIWARVGMATVYAAFDPVLDRRVALKILNRAAHERQGPEFLLRDLVEYRDLGASHFDRRDKTKAISRLVRRLHALGCGVQTTPLAVSGGAS